MHLKNFLKRLVEATGYWISQTNNEAFFQFDALLYYLLNRVDSLMVVQVGANDGVTNDPIHDFVLKNRDRVKGVVIEPLPDFFEQLQNTYRSCPGITPLRCAIHNDQREMTIYRVAPEHLHKFSNFAAGISSFDPEHHHRTGVPSELIVAETVPCHTLLEVVQNHQLQRVDLLQIDAEGYDAEIILGLDFDSIAPAIIRFEHGADGGTMSDEQLQHVIDRLHENGYELAFMDSDAVAYRRELTLDRNLDSKSASLRQRN